MALPQSEKSMPHVKNQNVSKVEMDSLQELQQLFAARSENTLSFFSWSIGKCLLMRKFRNFGMYCDFNPVQKTL